MPFTIPHKGLAMPLCETVTIAKKPFNPEVTLRSFREANLSAGAIVSFVGQVRATSDGRQVHALTLEHYPGFTEQEISKIVENAKSNWPLSGVCIIHRVGRLLPGDPIVFIAAAAAHRRAAFDSVDYLMDYLKSEAPFWKCEETPIDRRWISPKQQDHKDKERWRELIMDTDF